MYGGPGSFLVDRATPVDPLAARAERPVLPRDDPASAPGSVAHAGVDPTLEGRALQDALRRAIARRRSNCSWNVAPASWAATLRSPEEQQFFGRTLEEALVWCQVWLMAPELVVEPFLV
jgi:hypothetical protein